MANSRLPQDDPVEQERKTLPRGSGDWPGFDHVYEQLQRACFRLASSSTTRCGDDHVHLMAVLGSGHEETMKAEMAVARSRGLLNG
jgi:hypothetical protein